MNKPLSAIVSITEALLQANVTPDKSLNQLAIELAQQQNKDITSPHDYILVGVRNFTDQTSELYVALKTTVNNQLLELLKLAGFQIELDDEICQALCLLHAYKTDITHDALMLIVSSASFEHMEEREQFCQVLGRSLGKTLGYRFTILFDNTPTDKPEMKFVRVRDVDVQHSNNLLTQLKKEGELEEGDK